jgi:hypothetical protein
MFKEDIDPLTGKSEIHSRNAQRKIESKSAIVPDEILNFINNVPEKIKLGNSEHKSLMSGNCAVFASALQRIFKKGKLVAIVADIEPEYFFHVLLNMEQNFYDARGVKTKEELLESWNKGAAADLMKSELKDEYQSDDDDAEEIEDADVEFRLVTTDEQTAMKYTEEDYDDVDKLISIIT